MRTVIVRLRPMARRAPEASLDILSGPERRADTYALRKQELHADAASLRGPLEGESGRTRERYTAAFTRFAAGTLDILSSEPGIESGVVHYEELLASRAYAVTATDDVIEKLQR